MNEYLAKDSPPSTDSSRNEVVESADSFRYTASGVSRSADTVSDNRYHPHLFGSIFVRIIHNKKPPRLFNSRRQILICSRSVLNSRSKGHYPKQIQHAAIGHRQLRIFTLLFVDFEFVICVIAIIAILNASLSITSSPEPRCP